ncbi:hypothetical protein [Agrobacterium tumefaciens]|uniref:hypothetical protein n=1 Tax=Agrobacterium tumefaciens TaxID=358 RepID=UPI0013871DB2|nr:hypothetical protein [Agrobacterium tumefaciens]
MYRSMNYLGDGDPMARRYRDEQGSVKNRYATEYARKFSGRVLSVAVKAQSVLKKSLPEYLFHFCRSPTSSRDTNETAQFLVLLANDVLDDEKVGATQAKQIEHQPRKDIAT